MPELVAYVDESGNRGGVAGEGDHFVLGCVAGDRGALADLAGGLQRLKLSLAPRADPAGWELHARDIMRGRAGPSLRIKAVDDRIGVLRRVVGVVCEHDITLFGVVVKSSEVRWKRARASKNTEYATSLLVERLEGFARAQGHDTTCSVVSDNTFETCRLSMARAVNGPAAGRLSSLRARSRRVTGIAFVDSRTSLFVQAADSVAFALNRHASGDARFGGMLESIRGRSWRGEGISSLRL